MTLHDLISSRTLAQIPLFSYHCQSPINLDRCQRGTEPLFFVAFSTPFLDMALSYRRLNSFFDSHVTTCELSEAVTSWIPAQKRARRSVGVKGGRGQYYVPCSVG